MRRTRASRWSSFLLSNNSSHTRSAPSRAEGADPEMHYLINIIFLISRNAPLRIS